MTLCSAFVKQVIQAALHRFKVTMIDWFALVERRLRYPTDTTALWRMSWGRWVAFAILAVGFACLAMDEPSAQYDPPQGQAAYNFALTITYLGKSDWILVPLALLLFSSAFIPWRALSSRSLLLWTCRIQTAWFVFISVAGSGLIATLLKQTIGRARPTLHGEVGAFYFSSWTLDYHYASFPSGHATTAAAFCMALIILFPRLRLIGLTLILWIAGSRAIIGVHYPSDVIAGVMLGVWFTIFVSLRFTKARFLFRVTEDGTLRTRHGYRLINGTLDAYLKKLTAQLAGHRSAQPSYQTYGLPWRAVEQTPSTGQQ